MVNFKRIFLLAGFATIVSIVLVTGQQRGGSGLYTTQQATSGRTAVQANCAGCHLADLSGQGEAPPLRGAAFLQAWGPRTTKKFLSLMQRTMPPQPPDP